MWTHTGTHITDDHRGILTCRQTPYFKRQIQETCYYMNTLDNMSYSETPHATKNKHYPKLLEMTQNRHMKGTLKQTVGLQITKTHKEHTKS